MNKYNCFLSPFKWFVLDTFPFIEDSIDALNEYQLLCKIVDYLNKVIEKSNNIGEQTEKLTKAFNDLKNYVDNYFDNLDVQEEINNKLDEMAESGFLTNLLLQYLNLDNNLKTNKIKWIAHRGASFEAPENTLPAWQWAKNQFFDGIEVDIKASSNGTLFCFHDDDVSRMTNGEGNFSDLTDSQIYDLLIDAGTNINEYQNLKIPTFGEFLRFCKSENIFPFIEIKFADDDTLINNFINTLRQNGFLYKCIVISFNTSILEKIKNIDAKIQCHAVLEISRQNIDYCISKHFGLDFRFFNELDNQTCLDLIHYAHSNNIEVSCWNYTSNGQNKPITWGVDYITCDKVMNINHGTDVYKSATFVNGFKSINKYVTQLLCSEDFVPYSNNTEDMNLYTKFYPYITNNLYRAFSPKKHYLRNNSILYANCPEGYKIAYIIFDKNGQQLLDSGWLTSSSISYTCNLANAKFAIFLVAKTDNTEMNHADYDKLRDIFEGIQY